MHWIIVGILIWIGLAVAPFVVGFIILAIPFVVFGTIGALGLGSLTQSAGGAFLGLLIGGILPYLLFNIS